MENNKAFPKERLLSAMFLVAGTCIGGGMLALPVATGISGFFPSSVIMLVCWLSMTITALLLLEVSLWMEEGVHIITMSKRILGNAGKIISWFLYLFICYASVIAYTAAGGIQIEAGFQKFFNWDISKQSGCLIFILAFGSVIYLGTRIVGRVNAILFIAMIAAYFGLVAFGLDEIKPHLLLTQKWSGMLLSIPLLLTAFSFQTMVPSLTPYLHRHAKALRLAILGGTTIAFLLYLVWQWLILGIVPVDGPHGLADSLSRGEPATQFLQEHVEGRWVAALAHYFAFFAIVTSFLGITLGLFDFLSDGLKIKKEGMGKFKLGLLIAIPTLICAVYFERAFIVALDASGGYGDTILNGIIPVLMVWIGRYKLGYTNSLRLPGGKPLLALILAFFIFSLCLELSIHLGFFSSIYESYNLVELKVET